MWHSHVVWEYVSLEFTAEKYIKYFAAVGGSRDHIWGEENLIGDMFMKNGTKK